MSEEEKEPYKTKANDDTMRYREAMTVWKDGGAGVSRVCVCTYVFLRGTARRRATDSSFPSSKYVHACVSICSQVTHERRFLTARPSATVSKRTTENPKGSHRRLGLICAIFLADSERTDQDIIQYHVICLA